MDKKLVLLIAFLVISVGFLSGCEHKDTTSNNKPPIVSMMANTTIGYPPLSVAFSVIANDTDGSIVSYHWDFGNESESFEQSPSHTFEKLGEYSVFLYVTDDDGGTTAESMIINVTDNLPPIAYAKADKTIGIDPFEVNFTGSGEDEDGEVVSYNWDFDDGATSDYKNPSHIFRYNFMDGMTFNVTLTVKDNKGAKGKDTIPITIQKIKFTRLSPIDDTYIDSEEPYINFGNYDILEVYGSKSSNEKKITYLKFDLSGIPINSTIIDARLEIDFSIGTIGKGMFCHRSQNITWSEKTIIWENAPSYSGDSMGYSYISEDWDVDSFVKNALSSSKITLVLVSFSEYKKFYSTESDIWEYEAPELYIRYS